MEVVKVVVLGAPQVGKSTLIKQFTQSAPCERVDSSRERSLPRHTYYQAVMLNSRLFAFRLHDLPSVSQFPVSSDQEWSSTRALGLRSAAAYLLVFDLDAPETFRYLRSVRQQMMAARDMHRVPVVVVANKRDRVQERNGTRGARELQTVVRKLWKWTYVECSAKYNYRVLQVFKELTTALDALDQHQEKPSSAAVETAPRTAEVSRPAAPSPPAPCRTCNIL